MRVIAHEKDYGDTVGMVYWCPSCGRAVHVDYPMQPDEDITETWHEPIRTLEAEPVPDELEPDVIDQLCHEFDVKDGIIPRKGSDPDIAARLEREMEAATDNSDMEAALDLAKCKGAR
jgi:hypothetical protein